MRIYVYIYIYIYVQCESATNNIDEHIELTHAGAIDGVTLLRSELVQKRKVSNVSISSASKACPELLGNVTRCLVHLLWPYTLTSSTFTLWLWYRRQLVMTIHFVGLGGRVNATLQVTGSCPNMYTAASEINWSGRQVSDTESMCDNWWK